MFRSKEYERFNTEPSRWMPHQEACSSDNQPAFFLVEFAPQKPKCSAAKLHIVDYQRASDNRTALVHSINESYPRTFRLKFEGTKQLDANARKQVKEYVEAYLARERNKHATEDQSAHNRLLKVQLKNIPPRSDEHVCEGIKEGTRPEDGKVIVLYPTS